MTHDTLLDSEQYPVFEGTPKETKEWLKEHPQTADSHMVRLGNSMDHMSVPEYLKAER